MKRPRRVAAIHDISGFGRCALSVIIPTISSMGVQVCPVPTAVLSTHTGGFTDIAIRDCHEFPAMADRHWRSCGAEIDCIYSGYLGDASQIEQVIEFKAARPGALLIVDPVMGDDGVVYNGISDDITRNMKKLCEKADLITPNTTEAALLLDIDYSEQPINRSVARELLFRLSGEGKTGVIVTGCPVEGEGICNLGFSEGKCFLIPCDYRGCSYPGTGDIFTSVVTGGLMLGKTLAEAAADATVFTEKCIALTDGSGEPTRDGVFLEYALPLLFNMKSDRCAVEL